jgi:type III pantothenate kinase
MVIKRGKNMILAIDVGNTNIVLGVINGDDLVITGRLSTNISETDEEYAMKLYSFLHMHNACDIDGAIISSVVPALIGTLKKAIKLVTGVNPLVVGPGIKTGLSIKIGDPAQLGADLVVGAVAAKAKYPCPAIIFDLGTATTGSVLDKDGNFLGGIITTGVVTSINALTSGTALLPQIDISSPKKIIGTNSIDSMKSGCIIGTAVMLDGFIEKFEEELGQKATVIVTGGLGKAITKNCKHKVIIDENLLIDGLKIIYNKNK